MNIDVIKRRVIAANQSVLFSDEYKSILSYAESNNIPKPSLAQNIINNEIINGLINLNLWDDIDLFYFFRQNCDKDFAKINWKNPSSFYLTSTNEPLFINSLGFQGGSSTFFNTNFNLRTNRLRYNGNNVFLAFKCFNVPNPFLNGNNIAGARVFNDFNQIYISDNQSNTFITRAFSITNMTINQNEKNENFISLKLGTAATDHKLYKNGVFFDFLNGPVGNTPNTNIPFLNLYLLALNNNGTALPVNNNVGLEYFSIGRGTSMDGNEFQFNEIITQ